MVAKKAKAVVQINEDGDSIAVFKSARRAAEKLGSGRTGNRAFISLLPSDELEPLIMGVSHRRPTATHNLSEEHDAPPEALTFN